MAKETNEIGRTVQGKLKEQGGNLGLGRDRGSLRLVMVVENLMRRIRKSVAHFRDADFFRVLKFRANGNADWPTFPVPSQYLLSGSWDKQCS